jgi:Fe-S cluster assembly protein SufB
MTQDEKQIQEEQQLRELADRDYKWGFVTDIDSDTVPPGLDEGVIRHISRMKGEPEWLLAWRLKAYRHWLKLEEPEWAKVEYPPIDFQAISYYSAPKQEKPKLESLDEVDPKLLETYEKLGITLLEQ